MKPGPKPTTLLERIERRLRPVGECVEWAGFWTDRGAPTIWDSPPRRRKFNVRRVLYELSRGPIVGHRHWETTCGNPRCVRAEHQQPQPINGSPVCGRRRFTDDDIRAIRERLALGERGAQIAREFGVTRAAVSQINRCKSYRRVNDPGD